MECMNSLALNVAVEEWLLVVLLWVNWEGACNRESGDAAGACGARLMGSVGAESQEEVGEGMGPAQEGGGGRGGNER